MKNGKFYICVYGAVNNKIDSSYIDAGILLGKKIAEKDWGLVFSGMRSGISGAVANGVATLPNASIIAIMPEFFRNSKQEEISENCTKTIFAKDISERKKMFKDNADAIIVAPGGVGTFDEFFDAVCTKRWGLWDKPLVIYNINNYYNDMINMLEHAIETNFGKENYRETYKVFDNIDEMFEYIENYNKK